MANTRIYGIGVLARARLLVAPQGVRRKVVVRPNNAVVVYLGIDQKPTLRSWQWQAAPSAAGSDKVELSLEANQSLWGVTRGPLADIQISIEYFDTDPNAGVDSLLLLFQNTPADQFDAIERECVKRAGDDAAYLTEAIEAWKSRPYERVD